jgi:hypothetical protein
LIGKSPERPIYRGNERVTIVHPANGLWGKLLDPAHRASRPNRKNQDVDLRSVERIALKLKPPV